MTETSPDAEPCVGHHPDNPKTATRGLLCPGHAKRLRLHFVALPKIAAWLDLNTQPVRAPGEPVSGSREAPVPVRLDVLDLIGPASRDDVHETGLIDAHGHPTRDQIGRPHILAVLRAWARLVSEQHHTPLPPVETVTTLSDWFPGQLDWIRNQAWVALLLNDLFELERAAMTVAPWMAETIRDRQETCTHCGLLALVIHIGLSTVKCENRLGGCGRSRSLSEYELRALLPETRRGKAS